MLHKYIDKVFRKSIKNKNKLIPASYESKIMNVLESLPQTSVQETETQVQVVKHERKIYLGSFATAAAVLLVVCGIVVHNNNVNVSTRGRPDKNNKVTTVNTATSYTQTTVAESETTTTSATVTTVTENTSRTTVVLTEPVHTSKEYVNTTSVVTKPAITEAHTSVTEETTVVLSEQQPPEITAPVIPPEHPEQTKVPLPEHKPKDDDKTENDDIHDDENQNTDIEEVEKPDNENLPDKFPHNEEKPVIVVPPGAVKDGHIHMEPPCHHDGHEENKLSDESETE